VNASTILHLTPLFAMLIWASVTDLRERKIRNWLTLTMIITGLAQSLMPGRFVTPGASALGMLIGFALPFALFAMGAIGAGDVKLLTGVGAWLGPVGILSVFFLEAVIGMIIVLAQAVWQGRLPALLHNSVLLTINLAHLREVGLAHVTATGKASRSVDKPLPYAVPVLLAVAILVIKSYVMRGG
jgi:prepilin peptidase CpaA